MNFRKFGKLDFDVSEVGFGAVAKVIKGRRDQVIVSTKGGLLGHHRDPKGEPVNDRPEKIIEACEASLRRLETDYIDVYFCHLWWDKYEETEASSELSKN